ncbi:APA family basic amino acid/polyamine antiporter [Novosphingobium capsulatum]|uniref:Arginine/agmatine antiporter n=1 Tax=Novosphingobium capsulatum TaxID=13688 RepID=A0ABU1MHC7_9SPHN|nr:amino acid permease [Novosphingobium capsulatum]MDR6509317.1 APA family basic amino acid/polyamine antiporter [Novosphingobium capsulatum]WQD92260.1 amino acid permease [Novosphingobium capsulatum]
MNEKAKRGLGFWMTLALVVGNLIGSGIYLLPATLAPLGANQLAGWMVTIGGSLCMATVFARLSARQPLPGGPFAYVMQQFGPGAGFAAAWAYWTMLWAGNGAVAVAVVSNLSLLVPWLSHTPGAPAAVAVGAVWLLTAVNIRGVRGAGDVQVITTVLKLVPLVGLIGLALWLFATGTPHVAQPPVPLSPTLIASAAGLTFWGFLGLESATVPSDKVENAGSVVPRATLWGVALAGAVYLGIALAFQAYMPQGAAAASPSPVAEFLGQRLGGDISGVVAIFAAISAFGTLNGFILVQGEVPWAMARDGLFPAWFGKETKAGTPINAHLVSSGLLTVITLLNYGRDMGNLFTFIASISLAAGMLTYIATMASAMRLLRDEPWVVVLAVLAAAFNVWALWGLGLEAIAYGLVLVALGLPVYLAVRWRKGKMASAGA